MQGAPTAQSCPDLATARVVSDVDGGGRVGQTIIRGVYRPICKDARAGAVIAGPRDSLGVGRARVCQNEKDRLAHAVPTTVADDTVSQSAATLMNFVITPSLKVLTPSLIKLSLILTTSFSVHPMHNIT